MEVLDFIAMDDAPFKRHARYADLDSIPDGWVGELIDGDLYAFPRPRTVHARAIGRIYSQLDRADDDAPSGWIILPEPQIRFGRHLLVPDLAGWRRSRMPDMPDVPTVNLAPDWVCEGLSPSTARIDKGRKREIYAKHGVSHLWFANPELQIVEVLTLDGPSYRLVKTAATGKPVLAPFTYRIELAKLWRR